MSVVPSLGDQVSLRVVPAMCCFYDLLLFCPVVCIRLTPVMVNHDPQVSLPVQQLDISLVMYFFLSAFCLACIPFLVSNPVVILCNSFVECIPLDHLVVCSSSLESQIVFSAVSVGISPVLSIESCSSW